MAGFAGRTVVFAWGGANTTPLGVREKSLTLGGDPIDVSSDDSSGWRELLNVRGQKEVSITISGVVKDEDLKKAWFNGNIANTASFTYSNGGKANGQFILSSYEESMAYNDAATFTAELRSTGAITYTAGA